MRAIVVRRPHRRLYSIVGGTETFTITLADDFWAEGLAIVDGEGGVHTELDANIAALCEELKYALYYVAVGEGPKH